MAMSMNLSDIGNMYGKLKSVYSIRVQCEDGPDMVVGVHLVFEKGEVFHEALAEFDEISCSQTLSGEWQEDALIRVKVSHEAPWISVVDRKVLWLWTMTNHQGYSDAILYSFANSVEDNEQLIQLVTIASVVKVYGIERKL